MTETSRLIHLGDAGKGALACGAKELAGLSKNWTWVPEKVTCKKCLRIYKRGLRQ